MFATTQHHGRRLRAWERMTEWPLTAAAIVFLLAYTWEVLGNLDGAHRRLAETVINVVWVALAIDYAVRLALARHRREWFTKHLLDLGAVALPMIRPLRLLRLVALLGALQRGAGTALRGRITAYTAGSVSMLCFVASLAVLEAERNAPGAEITSFGEAIWWALVTITTVGYGELSPVTPMGRCVAVTLMIGGVALIGVVTATLASWIVSLVAEEAAEQEAATRAQVNELQQQVSILSEQITRLTAARAEEPHGRGGPRDSTVA